MDWRDVRNAMVLCSYGLLVCGGLYLLFSGCAVQIPIEVDRYMGEHAVAVGVCRAAEDAVTLDEWITAACTYLDTQELVLGYVVSENSIHIRFASVKSPAVVCFPCELERE